MEPLLIDPSAKWRKLQALAFRLFLLIGFMGILRVAGLLPARKFPMYADFVLSGLLFCSWLFLTLKIRKIESGGKNDDMLA